MGLDKLFTDFIDQNEEFQSVLKIVRQNSQGKIWLIGGFISRNLANLLYGTGKPEEGDYDFIVEELAPEITLPANWVAKQNSFDNIKLTKNATEIDLVPITNIHSILARKLRPTIDNFLSGTPLTIQSLCYDFESKTISGLAGIDAIKTRTVAIHNLTEAQHLASKKETTLGELAEKVARSFEFKLEI